MSSLLVTGCVLSSIAVYAYHSLNQGRLTDAQTKVIKEKSDYSNRIQSVFELALKQMNLDGNSRINLFIVNGFTPGAAFGNIFSGNRGIIVSLGYLEDTTDEEFSFIIKHEITHIQKNHLLKIPFYSFLAGSVPLVASYIYSINPIIAIAISVLSTLGTIFLYTRSSENEAHAVAAQHSSEKEIQSYIGYIEKVRKSVISKRKYYKDKNDWRYHLHSKEGNLLMDFLHPSKTTEQAQLEKILRIRGQIRPA